MADSWISSDSGIGAVVALGSFSETQLLVAVFHCRSKLKHVAIAVFLSNVENISVAILLGSGLMLDTLNVSWLLHLLVAIAPALLDLSVFWVTKEGVIASIASASISLLVREFLHCVLQGSASISSNIEDITLANVCSSVTMFNGLDEWASPVVTVAVMLSSPRKASAKELVAAEVTVFDPIVGNLHSAWFSSGLPEAQSSASPSILSGLSKPDVSVAVSLIPRVVPGDFVGLQNRSIFQGKPVVVVAIAVLSMSIGWIPSKELVVAQVSIL